MLRTEPRTHPWLCIQSSRVSSPASNSSGVGCAGGAAPDRLRLRWWWCGWRLQQEEITDCSRLLAAGAGCGKLRHVVQAPAAGSTASAHSAHAPAMQKSRGWEWRPPRPGAPAGTGSALPRAEPPLQAGGRVGGAGQAAGEQPCSRIQGAPVSSGQAKLNSVDQGQLCNARDLAISTHTNTGTQPSNGQLTLHRAERELHGRRWDAAAAALEAAHSRDATRRPCPASLRTRAGAWRAPCQLRCAAIPKRWRRLRCQAAAAAAASESCTQR